jgi:hypothetical protein
MLKSSGHELSKGLIGSCLQSSLQKVLCVTRAEILHFRTRLRLGAEKSSNRPRYRPRLFARRSGISNSQGPDG